MQNNAKELANIRSVRSKVRSCLFNRKEQVAEGTTEVWFDIPEEDFQFIPGQYVRITNNRISPDEKRGNTRDFSITSTPEENTKSFSIAFRNSDSVFKQSLLNAKEGDEFIFQGPLGVFTLPIDPERPVLFLAAGIGITPFISIIRSLRDDNSGRIVHVIYSDADENHFAYINELLEITSKNQNIIVTKHTGNIAISDIKNYATFDRNMIWYICGPSDFVIEFTKSIPHNLNVREEDIRTEEYVGYNSDNPEYFVPKSVGDELKTFSEKDLQVPKNLQALLDAVGQTSLFSVTDRQGSILYVNNKFLEISKYELDELIGQNHRILKSGFHPASYYREIWKNISQGISWRGAIKNRAKDGTFYWVDTTISPILDQNGVPEFFLAVRVLISDKKELEESRAAAIKNLEVLNVERNEFSSLTKKFELATGSAGIGIWEWDVVKNHLVWDDRMYALYGMKKGDFGGAYEAWQKGLHPDDKKQGDDAIQAALKGEKDFSPQFRVLWPNGTIHYIQAHATVERDTVGKPLKMTGVNWDITADKVSEDKLKQFEAVIRDTDAAVFTQTLDGTVTSWNAGAQKLYGYTPEEIIGKSIRIVIPPGRDELDQLLAKIAKGERISNYATLRQRKDGSLVDVSLTISPIYDDHNIIVGASVVARDISKEKIIDKEKTEFVSLASHQLKTPIGSIQWNMEMILAGDYGEISEKQKDVLQETYIMSTRMNDLVNALLNISRIEMGVFIIEPTPTDFAKLCDEVLVEMEPRRAKKGHELTKDFQENLPQVSADLKLLRIVFQNFVSNAIKYTPDNGKINVSLKADEKDITFSVTNNGEPIPEADQAKIFTKMFRASNAQEQDPDGNGLGLYVVKQIVENAGGKIWFTSKAGEDTVFACSLPLSGMIAKTGTKPLA